MLRATSDALEQPPHGTGVGKPSHTTPEDRASQGRGSSGPETSKASGSDRVPERPTSLNSVGSAITIESQPIWKSIFSTSVYFPQFVGIRNAKLAILYYVLTIALIVAIIMYFLMNSEYNIERAPFAMIHLCIADGSQCKLSMDEMLAVFNVDAFKEICIDYSNYEYWKSPFSKWTPSGCARVCGSQTVQDEIGSKQNPDYCMFPEETLILSPQIAFVPTYIRDTTYMPPAFNGNCMLHGYNKTPDGNACFRKQEKFVPGAGQQILKFAYEFIISPEMAAFVYDKENKKAFSKAESAQPWRGGMKTILFSYDGMRVKEWPAGSWIDPSVDMLLGAADYDDVGPSGALTLDQVYSRRYYGVPMNKMPNAPQSGVSLRITGVTITVDIAITDNGHCHHVKLEQDFDVGDGPVACMFTHAERVWTHEGTQYQMGSDGSYKEIQRSGVRIKFRPKGSIQVFDLTSVMRNFTVTFVWIQVPLLLVYYFTVFCLGHLSSVYSRVIHHELSLGNACKGLAARLVSHSAAYSDLQDRSEGISKNGLRERFKQILDRRIKNGELQPDEIDNYVEFVFEGMQSMGGDVGASDSINIQEFCRACCTNEPLSFESLVMLFDKDRKISFLESFFLDDTIRGVIRESKKILKEKVEVSLESAQQEEALLNDSVLRMRTCSDRADELEDICENLTAAASSQLKEHIDLGRRAAVVAARRRVQCARVIDPITDFLPTEDPKPDQRESECSVADEMDPGRCNWDEAPSTRDIQFKGLMLSSKFSL